LLQASSFAVRPGLFHNGPNLEDKSCQYDKGCQSNPAKTKYLLLIKDGRIFGFGISAGSLIIGFLAAYLSGYLACTWMINLVKKGNLYWFAIYCAIVGLISIIFA